MMNYQIVHNDFTGARIVAEDENGKVWTIPFDESNSDYQQYLIDTDGGLPIPEES